MGRSVFVHFVGNTILLFNVPTYFQMSAPPYFFRFTFYISKCQFPKSKIMGFVKTTFCPCAANGTEKAPYIYPQKPLLQHDGHFMILDSYIFLIQYFLLPFSILSVTYFVRFTTSWSMLVGSQYLHIQFACRDSACNWTTGINPWKEMRQYQSVLQCHEMKEGKKS